MNTEHVNQYNKIQQAGRSTRSLINLTFLARTFGHLHSTFTVKEVCDVLVDYLDVPESQIKGIHAELDKVLDSSSIFSKIRTDSDRLLGVVDPFAGDRDRRYFFICLELN